MMKQNILLAGATILISFLGNIVVSSSMEWKRGVDSDRSEHAKLIVQLQERSHYLYGDVKAAPVATPSERLKVAAAESK